MRKITAQVVIQSGNGFVESGAYASPTERDIFTQFKDENGNVTSINAASVTRFFTDKPQSLDIRWKNKQRDLYNSTKESGEDHYNGFTTIHGDEDVVCRIGCEIIDENGFRLWAEPAIVTVLGPHDGYE